MFGQLRKVHGALEEWKKPLFVPLGARFGARAVVGQGNLRDE